ncbi:MAG: uroporphyrinogen-III C-methyltransferase [Candidatus Azotimanducaceae bacterium]
MKWLIVGNFLIALIAIFLSAFVFKEYKPSDLAALERRIIIHENKVMELSASLKNMTEAFNVKKLFLKEMEDQQTSFHRDISLRNEVLDQEILSLKQRIKNDPEVIALLEIEYLIRVANQKSTLERNPAAARFLMKEVSERLEKNSKLISEFTIIKEAIDQDIKALETIDLPDISKIYQEIDNIAKRVTSLEFSVDIEGSSKSAKDIENTESGFNNLNTDSVFLNILISELSKLVEFGKIDTEFKPVLSDKEDHLLRQRVNINLDIAKLSLLRGNNEIFRESLAEAKETLSSHFQLNEELDSIHADLKALDDVLVEKQGASLSRSLSRVRNSINKVADQELP